MVFLLGVSLVLWIKLIFFHGYFWQKGPILFPITEEKKKRRNIWNDVHIIVPARDEAETIEKVILSLLNQDYSGYFDITLVDDESTDGTGKLIQQLKETLPESQRNRLGVIYSAPRAEGWSGKLWALSQGINEVNKKNDQQGSFFLLTDADIVHESSHLTSLMDKALSDNLDQVSEMVQLRCENFFEKALIPVFVFFFCMLYPFAKVNKVGSSVAAGAGGTVLIRKRALQNIGGIAALKNALIDDVTLASLVKKKGGRIYLGHSSQAFSLRPYENIKDIWDMVTRSAYVQLHYSIGWLIVTFILMSLVWFLPVIQVFFAKGIVQKIAFIVYLISILSFIPTLSRFRLSYSWIIALPLIAMFYLIATLGSAFNYYRGKGMVWKGRAYTDSVGSSYKSDVTPMLDDLIPLKKMSQNSNQKDNFI